MPISALYIFIVYTAGINIIQATNSTESTLQQVHVVFRNGDRAPEELERYPKDPYINDTWSPYGLGGITNVGKKQEYELGKVLRKRYGEFLGDTYLPGIQKARSTSEPLSKMSMQLVLAGLWPPTKEQTVADDLPWQPIDYDYVPYKEDTLLGYPLLINCPSYAKLYTEIESLEEVQNYLKTNKEKINYINENSGLQIASVLQLSMLYFGLYTEEHTNRTLPEWTKSVYPEFLEDAAIYAYELQTATNEMIKSAAGTFLKEVLRDANRKKRRKLLADVRINRSGDEKMYLYSAHGYNIAFVLRAIQCFKPHIPQYASYMIFELHKINEKYGFKIFYQDLKQAEPQVLVIPGCEEFCPIVIFQRLVKDIIPEPYFIC